MYTTYISCWAYYIKLQSTDAEIYNFFQSIDALGSIPVVNYMTNNIYHATFKVINTKHNKVLFDQKTKILTLFINWSMVKFNLNQIRNLIGQLLFYISSSDNIFPIHSSAISYNDKSFLFLGAALSGKTNISYLLCKKYDYKWLSNDWTALKYSKNEILVKKGHDFINFRYISFNSLNVFLPNFIRHDNASKLLCNDPYIKTPNFSHKQLYLNKGELNNKISGIFFISIAEGTKTFFYKIPKSHFSELLTHEFLNVLLGLRTFICDRHYNVLINSFPLIPDNGYQNVNKLINAIINKVPIYHLTASLKNAINIINLKIKEL